MPSPAFALSCLPPLSLHDALPICFRTSWPLLCGGRGAYGHRHQEPVPLSLDAFESLSATDRRAFATAAHGQQSGATSNSPTMAKFRSEEHTSELQSPCNLVCPRLLSPSPASPLFPYTTLFRSVSAPAGLFFVVAVALMATGIRSQCRCRSTLSSHSPPRIGVHLQLRHTDSNQARLQTVLPWPNSDRKSTRLNSSHLVISYALACFRPLLPPPSFPTRRSSDLFPHQLASSLWWPWRLWPQASGASAAVARRFRVTLRHGSACICNCGTRTAIRRDFKQSYHGQIQIGRAHV